jgi:hypothetical protein
MACQVPDLLLILGSPHEPRPFDIMAQTPEHSGDHVPIPGSERFRHADSRLIRPTPDDELIVIRPLPDSPPSLDLEYCQDMDLSEDRFLTPEAHTNRCRISVDA